MTPSVALMISLARRIRPSKIGYDQGIRWTWLDKKNRRIIPLKACDCSSLSAGLAYLAGWDVDLSGACWTGNIAILMKAAGWKVLKFTKISDVRAGDMVVKRGAHVVLALSKTEWLSAQADERGRKSGGKLGDQTGKEVVIRAPYNRSGGWDYILRPPADPNPPVVDPPVVDPPVVDPPVVDPPVVIPPTPANKIVITEVHLAEALKGAGSSTTRSKVRIYANGRTVDTSLSQLADLASQALVGYKHNDHAITVWVATMLQESAWLQTTVEYGEYTKTYDPYRGRTFEQLTHKSNYAGFGQWCFDNELVPQPDYFVKNPDELGALKFAWLGGTWYFDNRKLWTWASAGDFQRVQTAVNFGTATTTKVPSGWFARLRAYRAFLSVYAKPKLLDVNGQVDVATRKRVQEFIGAGIDGDWGPQTSFLMGQWLELGTAFNVRNSAHVKALQRKLGLTGGDVDGVWLRPVDNTYGPTTTKALQAYLNKYR